MKYKCTVVRGKVCFLCICLKKDRIRAQLENVEKKLSAGGFDVTGEAVFANFLSNGFLSDGFNGKRVILLLWRLLRNQNPSCFSKELPKGLENHK